MIPAYVGMFRTQGVITTKAALRDLGLPAGPVRLPLVDATAEEVATLRADLASGRGAGLRRVRPGQPELAPRLRLRQAPCESSRSAGSARSGATWRSWRSTAAC